MESYLLNNITWEILQQICVLTRMSEAVHISLLNIYKQLYKVSISTILHMRQGIEKRGWLPMTVDEQDEK